MKSTNWCLAIVVLIVIAFAGCTAMGANRVSQSQEPAVITAEATASVTPTVAPTVSTEENSTQAYANAAVKKALLANAEYWHHPTSESPVTIVTPKEKLVPLNGTPGMSLLDVVEKSLIGEIKTADAALILGDDNPYWKGVWKNGNLGGQIGQKFRGYVFDSNKRVTLSGGTFDKLMYVDEGKVYSVDNVTVVAGIGKQPSAEGLTFYQISFSDVLEDREAVKMKGIIGFKNGFPVIVGLGRIDVGQKQGNDGGGGSSPSSIGGANSGGGGNPGGDPDNQESPGSWVSAPIG